MDDLELGVVLGQGATGRVYRARHRPTGKPVAVKTLRTDSRIGSISLDRELAAMARLGHAHILQVYGHGVVGRGTELPEGTAWIALEYASGGSLEGVEPQSWEQVNHWLLLLTDALAHAHARGIVHRDLKPDNVMVCTGDDVRPGLKLADFGLAWALDRDRAGIRRGGTPNYIAPEQARGSVVELGPWTDLYTLGAVAWRWLTGAVLFPYEGIQDQLQAHQHESVPVFSPRFRVPRAIEGLLRAMLAKEPAARPGSAAEVLHHLLALEDLAYEAPPARGGRNAPEGQPLRSAKRLGVPQTWRGGEGAPLLDLAKAGAPLVELRDPPLIGREEERDALWRALRQVADERRPRVVLLEGDPGVGTSRLARWLHERALELGVAEGHLLQGDGGVDGLVERAFGMVGARTGSPWPTGTLPAERVVLASRDDLAPDRLARWLEERARHGLVLLRVEGAAEHPAFAELITEILLAESSSPILVTATTHPDGPLWEDLRFLEGASRVEVPSLPADALRMLSLHHLGLEQSTATRLCEVCAGNPGLLVRWTHDLLARGRLHHTRDGRSLPDTDPLEPPVRHADIQRFRRDWDSFGPDERRAVGVGALLGPQVHLPEWLGALRVLGLRPTETPIRRLARGNWVHRDTDHWRWRDQEARWFVRSTLVDAAAAHHAIATALLDLASDAATRARAGGHLVQAGVVDLGLEVLREALLSDTSLDPGLVVSLVEPAIAAVDFERLSPTQRFGLLFPLVQSRRRLTSKAAVRPALDDLVELARHQPEDRATACCLMVGEVWCLLGEHQRALAVVGRLPGTAARWRIEGIAHHGLGDEDQALEHYGRAYSDAEPAMRGVIANGIGRLEAERGRPEAAARWFQQALPLLPPHARVVVHGNLALLQIRRQDPEGALEHGRRCWELRAGQSLERRAWAAFVASVAAAANNDLALLGETRGRSLYFLDRFADVDRERRELVALAARTARDSCASFLWAVLAKLDAALATRESRS